MHTSFINAPQSNLKIFSSNKLKTNEKFLLFILSFFKWLNKKILNLDVETGVPGVKPHRLAAMST